VGDRMTNARPAAARPDRAGLVHDGTTWVSPGDVGRYAPAGAPRRHAVPEGVDGWQPDDATLREYVGEHPDGLGGYLRVAPQSAWDEMADDEALLSGEELYRSLDGTFEVEPLEDDAERERRRRLLRIVERGDVR
jgi:hypothetical protein